MAVRSCNGSGKTYTAAYAVLWWLMCFEDALAITTAPSEHQVRDVLWREIRRAYRGHEALFGGALNRTSLELGDKHYANGLSMNTPDRFQGFREGNIIDLRDATKGRLDAVFGTSDNVEGQLHDWVKQGKSDVVVFYSGHGVPGLKDRRGYLLPVDGDPNLLEINGYPVDLLYANLEMIGSMQIWR